MISIILPTAFFAIALFFFTSGSLLSMRMAGAFPFFNVILGLIFLYLFIATPGTLEKTLSGIMFLARGFCCMTDIEKLRRHRVKSEE